VLGLAAAAVGAASTAQAATFVVNSRADRPDADVGTPTCRDAHGRCTLRAAIMQANFSPGPDTIQLPAGTFKLTRVGDDAVAVLGDLDITSSVTIVGRGIGKTIVDANGAITKDRAFEIIATRMPTAVTISGLTIRNGVRTATFDTGAGLLWNGGGQGSSFVLHDVLIEHCKSYYGGGIGIGPGSGEESVDLNRVTLRANSASAAGGGLSAGLGPYSHLTVRDSRLTANTAFQGGGAEIDGGAATGDATAEIRNTEIDHNQASHGAGIEAGMKPTLVIDRSDIHDNATQTYGGGVYNTSAAEIDESTIARNTATLRAGGLYAAGGTTNTLTNDTISGNTSQTGGALYVEYFSRAAHVVLTDVTVAGNSASVAVGGIFQESPATVTAVNTIIAKGASGANCNRSIDDVYDLFDDASCAFGGGAGQDAKLGPLADHGGPAPTQIPQAGSAALDTGTPTNTPAVDERGTARPQGAGYDIGAVEVCPGPPVPPVLLAPGARVHSRTAQLSWTAQHCIETYTVVVRRGSKHGRVVQAVNDLHVPAFTTRKLVRRKHYYWQVTVVADRGQAVSAWRRFKLQ
jgi:CSLREA domain-containing protein